MLLFFPICDNIQIYQQFSLPFERTNGELIWLGRQSQRANFVCIEKHIWLPMSAHGKKHRATYKKWVAVSNFSVTCDDYISMRPKWVKPIEMDGRSTFIMTLQLGACSIYDDTNKNTINSLPMNVPEPATTTMEKNDTKKKMPTKENFQSKWIL